MKKQINSPEQKKSDGKITLKKAVQSAVVFGALNMALSAFAADATVVQMRVKDLVARGLADRGFLSQLESNPAGAIGKQPAQFNAVDRDVVRKALQEINRIKGTNEGGGCGMAKFKSTPATRQ